MSNTLADQRLTHYRNMSAILERADLQHRSLTSDERLQLRAGEAELLSIAEQIHDQRSRPVPNPALSLVFNGEASRAAHAETEHETAFRSYIRGGPVGNALMEHRDMGEATGAGGGYLVPPGFLAKITEVLKWYGGVRQVANTITTAAGNSLVWPVNDDTANPAVIIGENTAVSETDLNFTQRSLGAKMWTTGSVVISRALMQDSAFDLDSVLADRFGKRLGRGQNTAFTTGTGVTSGLLGCPASGVAWSGTSGEPTYANLLAAVHSLDVAYRQNGAASWMVSDTMLAQIEGITDTAGRPLFVPAGSFGSLATGVSTVNGGVPGGVDTLLGYRVVVNNDLDAWAATGGGISALFGNFQAGYIIRDVAGATAILRLDERYADLGAIGFIGYDRCDGSLDDSKAIVSIANHA